MVVFKSLAISNDKIKAICKILAQNNLKETNQYQIELDSNNDPGFVKGQGPKAAMEKRLEELKREKEQIQNRINKPTE